MPRGDGTGPRGLGAMTGRGAGYCAGAGVLETGGAVPGRGFGMGFGNARGMAGMGRGCGLGWRSMGRVSGLAGRGRFGAFAVPTAAGPETEKQLLTRQAEALQTELENIRKRLAAMATESEE